MKHQNLDILQRGFPSPPNKGGGGAGVSQKKLLPSPRGGDVRCDGRAAAPSSQPILPTLPLAHLPISKNTSKIMRGIGLPIRQKLFFRKGESLENP